MVIIDYRPLGAVLISLFAALLILCSGRRPNLREMWTLLAAGGKALLVFSMLPAVLGGQILEVVPLQLAQGVALHLRADPAGMVFAVLASLLWIITSFYSIGYLRKLEEAEQTGYFASFAVCLAATMGIAFAANLLTFFVFYEILTIATYPLVAHHRDPDAIKAGRKYLAYTMISGQLLLVGIIWLYFAVGHGTFQPGGFLAGKISTGNLRIIFWLMILGTAVKAGIMPFHGWLPSAMVAPTPVSALLHAVAVVKAGVFGIMRITAYCFGPQLLATLGVAQLLAYLAAFTIVVSSLIALAQDNLKKRLAFSTIGQLSYIVLGATLLTPLGLIGGLYHIAAHAVMKITLFFCAGAIFATTRLTKVSELNGLGRAMPYTMGAFAVGALGITGLPFLVGFISKWNLALGSLQGGQSFYVFVLLLSGLLSTAYFLPIVYAAFFKKPTAQIAKQHCGEADKLMLIPLLFTALVSVLWGIFPNAGLGLYDLATLSAQSVFSGQFLGGGW